MRPNFSVSAVFRRTSTKTIVVKKVATKYIQTPSRVKSATTKNTPIKAKAVKNTTVAARAMKLRIKFQNTLTSETSDTAKTFGSKFDNSILGWFELDNALLKGIGVAHS